MKLRPPANLRELFQMFGFYDNARGLESIVERFDFASRSPWRFQRIILGAVPPNERPELDSDPAAYARHLLSSDAFRRNVLHNFLDAFPEKRRLLFVHIEKCAGTDLTAALSLRYFAINGTMDDPFWLPTDQRLEYLRDLVLAVPFVDTFFVKGHVPLDYYVSRKLIRPGDHIFTIVRDPVEIVISAINYRLTRLQADPLGQETDTRLWLADLGLKQFPADAGTLGLLGYARRMLRTPAVVPDNILCHALGAGDSQSALANIVASDIEITDLTRYGTWLRERWGTASGRANQSLQFLKTATLDPEDRALIEAKTTEDQLLYATLIRHLDAAGRTSISGRVLAKRSDGSCAAP